MPRLAATTVMNANSLRSVNRNRGLTLTIARLTKNSGTNKIAKAIVNATRAKVSFSVVLINSSHHWAKPPPHTALVLPSQRVRNQETLSFSRPQHFTAPWAWPAASGNAMACVILR